jgi:ribulose-bisphosphate carboxylase large chain
LFLCGGGILAHPMGVAAGVTSIRQAWQAVREGRSIDDAARDAAELREALIFFGGRH